MYILAIDLGSTSFKAAVFGPDLKEVGRSACLLPVHCRTGGRVEHNPADVERVLGDSIVSALNAVEPDTIDAIAVTSQAQTFAVFDAAGQPKSPFLSWQDSRAEAAAAALSEALTPGPFAEHCSFKEVLAGLQLAMIRHVQTEQPGFIQRSDRLWQLSAYVQHLLTGRCAMDTNLAAMSGLFSIPGNTWWTDALEACGIYADQLPELVPVGTVAALTGPDASRFGLRAGVPVLSAGNDQTAGAYGARLHENNALLIGLGTAQVAYVCEAAPGPDAGPGGGPADVRGPYPGGRSYRMMADACGGNTVNWAQTILAGADTIDAFFGLAAQAPAGSHGLLFDAGLPAGTGSWQAIGLHHVPADFARSVLESLATRMAHMVKALRLGTDTRNVLIAGGGSRQTLAVDIYAQALGTSLTLTTADPLTGAALMALEARAGRGQGAGGRGQWSGGSSQ